MIQVAFKLSLVLLVSFQGAVLAVRAQGGESNAGARDGVITGRVTSTGGDLPNTTTVYVSASGAAAPPRSTIVNSDGTFKMDDLEIGVYRVWASSPGFVADAPVGTDPRGFIHTGEAANLRLKKGGVITGTVLNSSNAPVIGVNVRAFRIRDESGKPIEAMISSANERFTDDRGVYRIYGLSPGTYIVAAGGISRFYGGFSSTGYDQDVPTYAPSSTRDTAMEVTIRSGEEATADIQYRGEPGHAISGSVSGIPQPAGPATFASATINITEVKSKTIVMNVVASMVNDYAFAVYGVPDGEYELVAQSFSPSRDSRASDAKRIKVQGADVTGVNLNVALLPVINGRVVLDSAFAADCVRRRETALQETIVFARREKQAAKSTDSKATANQVPLMFADQIADAVPDAKGEFTLRNLHAGNYRLTITLPTPSWYLKSLTLGANPRTVDARVVSEGVSLYNQTVSGLTVTISEGAASVRGTVVTDEGKAVRDRLLVYLMPAEKESASNLFRYFETRSEPDGRFELLNIPPGEYLAAATSIEEDRPPGFLIRQDSNLRAKVVRDAQKSNQTITLKPCERIENFEIPIGASSTNKSQ
ncbi:MAG TPA: carboxypeptidase-like regulatory domain-containing protein [Pyrinomonadaceae bacterium]|nr:carboxypeptidase-like regulatory domain-containing protein [Pyrinomonadaceae bacterium]